ncbi:Threonine dehydratase [Hordeum vulgare]|nr:Threonine dehydratase [Hordeum vulgare]
MFTWRIKHESPGFRINLEKRSIKVESTKCLFCGCADEDGAHLFIKCKSVKEVWWLLELEKEQSELESTTSVMPCWTICGDYLKEYGCKSSPCGGTGGTTGTK